MTNRAPFTEIELFNAFSPEELDAIRSAASDLELVRGDVIFAENDEADALYIVNEGRIAIGNRSIDGRESMVALMERGELFGEMSLFDGLGRSAEARALEASNVTAVPYAPVKEILESRPAVLWSVVALLSRRLRDMDVALADAFFLDVTGRTAKRLLDLAGDEDAFTIPVTQEELAGMIGASRERVNKAIAQFQRLGWIEQQDREYRIVKRREMEIRST